MSSSDAKGFWFDFDGQTQKALKNLTIKKERKKPMTKKIQHKGAMIADQTQKKLILDVFNAGREFNEDYREGGFKYMRVWTIEQLTDLIDDMKDAFGIVPKISEYKDDDGSVMPAHYQDHVWSNDPRAWIRKD